MKQKKFKIESTALFIYKPKSGKASKYANRLATDPTTVSAGTSTMTGVF